MPSRPGDAPRLTPPVPADVRAGSSASAFPASPWTCPQHIVYVSRSRPRRRWRRTRRALRARQDVAILSEASHRRWRDGFPSGDGSPAGLSAMIQSEVVNTGENASATESRLLRGPRLSRRARPDDVAPALSRLPARRGSPSYTERWATPAAANSVLITPNFTLRRRRRDGRRSRDCPALQESLRGRLASLDAPRLLVSSLERVVADSRPS